MKPVIIKVYADKHNKLEPEEHRISFPCGEIYISRTSDNEHWAHIHVNNDKLSDESVAETFKGSKVGIIKGIRIDSKTEHTRTVELPDQTYHFAVKIGINPKSEVDEIHPEDLQAAAEYYDKLIKNK